MVQDRAIITVADQQ